MTTQSAAKVLSPAPDPKTTKVKAKSNVYQRMLAVMGELDRITKEQKKVNNEYRFVSHDAVAAAVHPLCVKHGLFICTNTVEHKLTTVEKQTKNGKRVVVVSEVLLEVAFINADEPSDRFSVRFPGTGTDNEDKACGKSVSYALKTALLKQFLLEGSEDNESRHNEPVQGRRTVGQLDPELASSLLEAIAEAQDVEELDQLKGKIVAAKDTRSVTPDEYKKLRSTWGARLEELKPMREMGDDSYEED